VGNVLTRGERWPLARLSPGSPAGTPVRWPEPSFTSVLCVAEVRAFSLIPDLADGSWAVGYSGLGKLLLQLFVF